MEQSSSITIKQGICGFCGDACLVDAHIKDGKIIKVEGNDTLPGGKGRLCVKGSALKQSLYHPERLLYPMKRIGARGEGLFQRITWDEALDTIAEKLRETKADFDAKQTLFYCGHPKWFRPQLTEFANAYGSPNFGTESSTCAYAMMMAWISSFGHQVFLPQPDVKNCKILVVWGMNNVYSCSVERGGAFVEAIRRGIKVIVIDPRCTPTSEHADLHLRPIPGTDGALALGMARVIITEGLQDQAYIDNYTKGFEAYRDYVMDFTPEKVETITGVPKEDMIKAARMMAENTPCPIQVSASPLVHHINGMQNARAVTLLLALTGSFGIKGGTCPPPDERAALGERFMGKKMHRPRAAVDLSHEEFPAWAKMSYHEAQVTRIADYLQGKGPYPIHNLIAFGMNHHMWPRPDRIEEGLKLIGFFANADLYMTETSRFADILLPIQTSMEREQLEILAGTTIYYQPPVVSPMGETKSDVEVIAALADRLGITIGEDMAMRSHEDYLRKSLVPTGLTLEEVKAAPGGIRAKTILPAKTTAELLSSLETASGKIEFVSSELERCGLDGLPIYKDFRSHLPMEEYPLILATGSRKPQLFHSRTYRLPWLAGLEPFPLVEVHPEDAGKLGLTDGEQVRLSTPVGSMVLTLSLNTSCLSGVVNVYHGLGEKDINLLLDDAYLDPISGFPGYKSYCCKLEKVEVHDEQSHL